MATCSISGKKPKNTRACKSASKSSGFSKGNRRTKVSGFKSKKKVGTRYKGEKTEEPKTWVMNKAGKSGGGRSVVKSTSDGEKINYRKIKRR
jgi:hypothetical protein